MKKKKPKNRAMVLQATIHLCWLKQRQHKARNKLLNAIKTCRSKQELGSMLLFGQFLQDEPAIRQAYNHQLNTLQEAA